MPKSLKELQQLLEEKKRLEQAYKCGGVVHAQDGWPDLASAKLRATNMINGTEDLLDEELSAKKQLEDEIAAKKQVEQIISDRSSQQPVVSQVDQNAAEILGSLMGADKKEITKVEEITPSAPTVAAPATKKPSVVKKEEKLGEFSKQLKLPEGLEKEEVKTSPSLLESPATSAPELSRSEKVAKQIEDLANKYDKDLKTAKWADTLIAIGNSINAQYGGQGLKIGSFAEPIADARQKELAGLQTMYTKLAEQEAKGPEYGHVTAYDKRDKAALSYIKSTGQHVKVIDGKPIIVPPQFVETPSQEKNIIISELGKERNKLASDRFEFIKDKDLRSLMPDKATGALKSQYDLVDNVDAAQIFINSIRDTAPRNLSNVQQLDFATAQQVFELVKAQDRVVSRGRPTVSAAEHLNPETYKSQLQSYLQKVSGMPVGANLGAFIQQIEHGLQREKQGALSKIKQNQSGTVRLLLNNAYKRKDQERVRELTEAAKEIDRFTSEYGSTIDSNVPEHKPTGPTVGKEVK